MSINYCSTVAKLSLPAVALTACTAVAVALGALLIAKITAIALAAFLLFATVYLVKTCCFKKKIEPQKLTLEQKGNQAIEWIRNKFQGVNEREVKQIYVDCATGEITTDTSVSPPNSLSLFITYPVDKPTSQILGNEEEWGDDAKLLFNHIFQNVNIDENSNPLLNGYSINGSYKNSL